MEKVRTQVVQRYVSLLTNAGFKAVFGDREVMSVINTLLPDISVSGTFFRATLTVSFPACCP